MAFVPDKPTRFVPDAPAAPDAIGAANAAEAARPHPSPVGNTLDMLKAGVAGVPEVLKDMASSAGGMVVDPYGTMGRTIAHAAHTVATALSDPAATLTSIGSALQNATPEQTGTAVVSPLLAGAGVGGVAGLAGRVAGSSAAAAAEGPLGMRTGEAAGIARNVAGDSAQPAVTAHNQATAEPALGAQAGVPLGKPVNAQTLKDARAAPNSVYARAENSIPTGPLSPNAAQMVNSVGGDDLVVRSPNTQALIDAQKTRLLSGDLTGPQVVNTQRTLRFNGFKGLNSLDPEQQTVGKAQIAFSDALHQHMLDTIPEDAPVSAAQLNQARTALAQNHTVEGLIAKGGNLDLQKLAKLHRESPELLTGPLREVAQFASDHPEVTSLPSNAERFNPAGVARDIASIDLKSPASYLQPFFGAAARRRLTGATKFPEVPVTGLAGEFDPLPPSLDKSF